MALCIPNPTLTLYATSTSSTVITTSTVIVQTQPDGTVSTVTSPLIVTSIVTVVNPTSTLFASCSGSTTPISTIPSSASQPSSSATPQPSPTLVVVTTTPPPTVVTVGQSTTLGNGVITVITITSTTTPPPTVIAYQTIATSQSPTSTSSSSSIAPIVGGAVGGFIFLVGLVAAVWFILKKCRKADSVREEDDVVLPYPVTRDRNQTSRLDLTRESRSYEYGLVGHSTPTTGSRSSPGMSNHTRAGDGRRDSATALIGPTSRGLPPMASANVASVQGTQSRGVDVGRQLSHSSTHQLPPGAAPPQDSHNPSVAGSGSVSGSSTSGWPSSRRPLQVINPQLSPMSVRSSVDMSSSGSAPMAVAEPDRLPMRPEKNPAQDFPSSSGAAFAHSDGGRVEGVGHRPSASGGSVGVPERKPPTQPVPTDEEPIDAPPAYAE